MNISIWIDYKIRMCYVHRNHTDTIHLIHLFIQACQISRITELCSSLNHLERRIIKATFRFCLQCLWIINTVYANSYVYFNIDMLIFTSYTIPTCTHMYIYLLTYAKWGIYNKILLFSWYVYPRIAINDWTVCELRAWAWEKII